MLLLLHVADFCFHQLDITRTSRIIEINTEKTDTQAVDWKSDTICTVSESQEQCVGVNHRE